MKNIKLFENFNDLKTFENLKPYELCLMSKDEVAEVISNTFKSKVVFSNNERTIVESEWKYLETDKNKYFTEKELHDLGKTYKLYFHILKSDFLILRSKESAILEEILLEIKDKYPEISNSGISTNSGYYKSSTILKGRKFSMLFFAMCPIIQGDYKGDEYLDNFFGSDIAVGESKSIVYYSNLLIGERIVYRSSS